MTKGIVSKKAVVCLVAAGVLGLCGTAHATNIAMGSDYFVTLPGAVLNSPFGPVPLVGKPFGGALGNTDTIVSRLADAKIPSPNGTSEPIPIQLVALSLQSASPVMIMKSFFDVFVALDTTKPSPGSMTITEAGGTGGTFTSVLNVNFVATFLPKGPGSIFTVPGTLRLVNPGAKWSNTPLSDSVFVDGLDCDNPNPNVCTPALLAMDQRANRHSGLAGNEQDFYVMGPIEHMGGHPVAPAEVPEPATLLLLGTGLVALGARKRKVV